MSVDFNPELDKITERELVYDIYSRIRTGKDITDPGSPATVLFPSSTLIQDIDTKTIMSLPTSLASNIDKLHTLHINVSINSGTELSCLTVGKATLVRAYLERSLIDISSLISTIYSNGMTTFKIILDVPFHDSDIIKLHYYYE